MIRLDVITEQKEQLVNVTAQVRSVVQAQAAGEGICVVSIPHTSAGITLNSIGDPATGEDVLDVLDQIAPRRRAWRQVARAGAADDAEAHIKGALVPRPVD